MRALLTSLIVLSFTASASADEAQEKLALLLRERSQTDFLIGQRIAPDKIPLEAWRNDRPDKEAWGPATPQPLFSSGGTLYIVNLWGTWCEPCKKELPLLFDVWSRLQEDAALKASLRLILVAVEGNPATDIRARQREFPLIGTQVPLFGDGASKLPQSLGDQTAYGQPSLPSTLLVDRCGVIRHAFVGPLIGRRAAFDTVIRRLAAATAGLSCPGDQQLTHRQEVQPHKEQSKDSKGQGKPANKTAEPGTLPPKGKRTDVAQAGGAKPSPNKKTHRDNQGTKTDEQPASPNKAGKSGKSARGTTPKTAKTGAKPALPEDGALPPKSQRTDVAQAGKSPAKPTKDKPAQ